MFIIAISGIVLREDTYYFQLWIQLANLLVTSKVANPVSTNPFAVMAHQYEPASFGFTEVIVSVLVPMGVVSSGVDITYSPGLPYVSL